MSLVPVLPLALQELVDYYRTAARECDFLIEHLEASLGHLEIRMKPSALVSVQFNKYEAYYVSFLQHLKWRLSDICVAESLEFRDSGVRQAILDHEYNHSGVAHPIDEEEIGPMLESLTFIRDGLHELIAEIEASMLKSIFLCHSSHDKPTVRRLAEELTNKGSKVWLDEAEILVGDSILEKIQDGISRSDYLGIVLSPRSVESIWVKKEVEAALTLEIDSGRVRVLPILIEECDIPLFLRPKKYANLSSDDLYDTGLADIVKRLSADA